MTGSDPYPLAPDLQTVGLRLAAPAHPDQAHAATLPREGAGRRIEDWIVSNLDGAPCPLLPGLHGDAGRDGPGLARGLRRAPRSRPVDAGWKRVRVREERGIAVVVLLDRSIVDDRNIREIAAALDDLIAAGSPRVVVDFDLVERCSSWFFALLAEAARRCRGAGGLLKICAVRFEIRGFFDLMGLRPLIPVAPDDASALAGDWPESPPTALPVSILAALKPCAGPGHGHHDHESDRMSHPNRPRLRPHPCPSAPTDPLEDLVARWLLDDGAGDPDDGPDPAAGPEPGSVSATDAPAPGEGPGAAVPLFWERNPYDPATGQDGMKCEMIEGVLVLTVLMPALADPSAVDLLRDVLARLHERTGCPRVVVSLCNVAFLSSAAVGVLVAHMLQLEWAGGGLRLCHILPPVMAVLKKIQLPRLVATYPTLDEAVLAAWQ